MSEVGPTKTVLIRITQADINAGCKYAPGSCPIAKAIGRRLRHRYTVSVLHAGIVIYVNSYHRVGRLDTPTVASDFMVNFDSGQKVQPFDLKLEVPLALYHTTFKK